MSEEIIEEKIEKLKMSRQELMKFAKGMVNSPLDLIPNRRQRYALTKKYPKEIIQEYLRDPQSHEKQLREVTDYLCTISPQFCTLIDYIPNMALITPFVKQKTRKYTGKKNEKDKKIKDFNKMCDYYERLNIKQNGTTILKEVFKYGIFYGVEVEGLYEDIIKRLDPNYCKIITKGESGYGIAFDFAYFNGNEWILDNGYPKKFRELFDDYQAGKQPLEGMNLACNWQPIPTEMTFVIKYDTTTNYSVPPYVNLYSALYDIEEYESLNKAKVTAENYTLIGLQIPLLPDAQEADDYAVSNDMVDITTEMLNEILPEYIGYFTTGCKIETVKASSSSDSKVDNVANAVKNFWNASGKAETIFGVDNQTEGTLKTSIMVDEQQLFSIYRQMEKRWDYKFKDKFKNTFKFILFDTTWFNITEKITTFTQQAQASIPVGIVLPLFLGFEITDLEDLVAMQEDIFDIENTWKPLASSFTQNDNAVKDNTNSTGGTDPVKGGAPKKKATDLKDSGQASRNQK